ncbi:MAG: site-specific tyrosine recombinase XerD, partial [Actinobacteria bacterium]|nr:site-specific tyrosine recombinase XerD [Actinomycetota bacterium]
MLSDYLSSYFNYLSIEKGLSKNTISAYRRDLIRFENYLIIVKKELKTLSEVDFPLYLA